MNNLQKRVGVLEARHNAKPQTVIFITYEEENGTEDQALAEWEAVNGPIPEHAIVFITCYEAPRA